ncbi:MAG TPA: acyl-CoA dehydrogenase [Oligoflexia bacterium]|nr:acyl-CoA dehydrogenase [Oligoflexia bacterium]HMR24990.1 acyl-CoA dehydrogenase [Oligoflexia bacterium]
MNFELTTEQQEIKNLVRDFAEKELRPIIQKTDQEHRFPAAQVKQLGEMGLMGVCIPTEYGGSGMDPISYAIVIEELARVCPSTSVITSVNNSLVSEVIKNFGTEEQKQRFLIPLAKGEHLGAYCLTEPQSGSDAGNQKTIAVRDGDDYIINGAKNWITNGPQSDTLILFCLTQPELGNKGITAFIIPTKTQGVEIGKDEDKMGIRGSGTCTISFNEVRVPVSQRLGEEKEGFKIAMVTLDNGRIGIGAQALGIAQAALEEAIKYSKQRKQFDQSLSQFQGIRWMLADMATDVESARLMVYQAAFKKWKNQNYAKHAAMAKLFASEVSSRVCNQALQIHGGYGYIKEYPVERFLRDARITEIYEGTSEIQRLVIANRLIKEYA